MYFNVLQLFLTHSFSKTKNIYVCKKIIYRTLANVKFLYYIYLIEKIKKQAQ